MSSDRAARRREADHAARLAVLHVLSTLRLDPSVASRLLADMNDEQLLELVESAEALAGRARGHLQSRGIAA